MVHKWRSEEQAILVGTQTVVDDNPKLNIRDWSGNNPVRVVLDQNNRISKDSFIFDNSVKTIVFTKSEINISTENTIFEVIDFHQNIIPQILSSFTSKSNSIYYYRRRFANITIFYRPKYLG